MESKLFRLKRIKTQVWRFFPAIFLVLSLVLIVLTTMEYPAVRYVKEKSISVFSPVVSVFSKPVDWWNQLTNVTKNWVFVYRENERLKSENEYLLKWRSLAFELLAEQKELKAYLNYVPPEKTKHITARIAMDEGSAFSRSFIVSAGENQGVKKGMLAFSPQGLFARVVEVMPSHARIMALTDYMSRVPVWVGENKVPALLIGDNTTYPYLQFLNEAESVNAGEFVMTSGHVGVYPSGLVIGVVEKIHEEEARVRLFENGEKLLFVRLVDFGLLHPLLNKEKE